MFRVTQSVSCRRGGQSLLLAGLNRRFLSVKSPFLRVSEEVQQAIEERRPVVALESTIYTHGFPYPDNVALASHLESVVRINGGVPATIGIIDGIARVGLSPEEVIRLAGCAGKPETLKISRRDLGFACGLGSPGRRYNGGTTVSGTMILAAAAGIKVFGTGGLGGVHRGAENSMDISADLTELGRTPVAVISSGCKSFLDIGRTLEYLETEGVPVATFADGRTGPIDFPAFWTRDSGIKSPMILQDEATAAAIIHAQRSLGLQTGLLFANPISEAFSIPKDEMDVIIEDAIREATAAGVTGSANTPYILAKIKELTKNKSIPANRDLIEGNVRRATLVATELAKLESETGRGLTQAFQPAPVSDTIVGLAASNIKQSGASNHHPRVPVKKGILNAEDVKKPSVFVAGALAVDFNCDYAPISSTSSKSPILETSNPARINQSLGGVAHNVARAAHLMGSQVRLCSTVGDDLAGKAALQALSLEGLDVEGIKTNIGGRTAQYIAVNDLNKDLVLAMADMSILDEPTPESHRDEGTSGDTFAEVWLPQIHEAKPTHIVLDANWSTDAMSRWIQTSKYVSAHVSFEPVSTAKATRIFRLPPTYELGTFPNASIHLSTPNELELEAMNAAARSLGFFDRDDWWAVIDALGIPSTGARVPFAQATSSALVDAGVPQQCVALLPFIPSLCVKLGSRGVLLAQILPAGDERLHLREHSSYILSRCNNQTEETLGVGGVYLRLFPPAETVKEEDIVSVNGVGDTFLGALVAGLAKHADTKIEKLIDVSQKAAVLTLKSKEAVNPDLASLR